MNFIEKFFSKYPQEKMVTAILLDEKVKDGTMMKVSAFAAGQEASNFHFKLEEGEEISKEDAMKALMLRSSNKSRKR